MWTPAQTTDFLAMSIKPIFEIRLASHIANKNWFVLAARSYQRPTPTASSDSVGVPVKCPHIFLMLHVPYLNSSFKGPNTKMIALLAPRDWSDLIARAQVYQLCDIRCVGIPYINRLPQCDSQGVLLRPVNQVEIKIIAKVWGIKHSEGIRCNLPLLIDYNFGHWLLSTHWTLLACNKVELGQWIRVVVAGWAHRAATFLASKSHFWLPELKNLTFKSVLFKWASFLVQSVDRLAVMFG